jgi:hypothetical protein
MLDSKSDDDIPAAAAVVVVPDDPPLAVVVAADPAPLANTIEYEAIPKVLFVDMQQQDEEKVAAAVINLSGLVHPEGANYKGSAAQALSSGAIAIILLLMRKWHYNRSIQFQCCQVLVMLTYSTRRDKAAEAKATAAAVSIINSGGIETIMAAMKSFPDGHDLQWIGCHAIGNAFAYYHADPTIDEAMARFVHKLNGIELVVTVMKKFQNIAGVQHMGCYVFNQLSTKQVLRDALKKGGALSAVGEAIEKHDDNSLQLHADVFFKNMFAKKCEKRYDNSVDTTFFENMFANN